MTTLYLATSNAGKVREISELLKRFGVEVLPRSGDIAAPVETGATLVDNAILKANFDFEFVEGSAVLADDSGLFVDLLDGAPGVYSSSFGGIEGDSLRNRAALRERLMAANVDSSTARFICVMALKGTSGRLSTFQGVVEGRVYTFERGSNGFGYDSMFIPDEGDGRTFGEMESYEKSTMSHRSRALGSLIEAISEDPSILC